MDICPQPSQNDFNIHNQVNSVITDVLQKMTRSGRQYGGKLRKTRRTRKYYGGAPAHCHMICAAIVAAAAGMTVAGIYYFYGASAGMLERAMGREAKCQTGIWQGYAENLARVAAGQPSCKEAADIYAKNVEALTTRIQSAVGLITFVTVTSQYSNLYNFVVQMTGCDVAQQVQATGSNCNPGTSGGNPPNNNINNKQTIPTIPPTEASLSFLDKLNSLTSETVTSKTVTSKKGGKKRRTKRKIYK